MTYAMEFPHELSERVDYVAEMFAALIFASLLLAALLVVADGRAAVERVWAASALSSLAALGGKALRRVPD